MSAEHALSYIQTTPSCEHTWRLQVRRKQPQYADMPLARPLYRAYGRDSGSCLHVQESGTSMESLLENWGAQSYLRFAL